MHPPLPPSWVPPLSAPAPATYPHSAPATLHLRLATVPAALDLLDAAHELAAGHRAPSAPLIDAEACAAWLAGDAPPVPACRHCAGLGRWDDTPCSSCGGSGRA